MIKQNQLNQISVKPVIADGNEPSKDRIKGYEYLPLLYANTFLCAKKKSGKTNVIYNLIENLVGPETEVYIFSSTLTKDPTYTSLMKMLKKKNITYEGHTSFIHARSGQNYLDEIIHDRDSDDCDSGDSNSGDDSGSGSDKDDGTPRDFMGFKKKTNTQRGMGPPPHHNPKNPTKAKRGNGNCKDDHTSKKRSCEGGGGGKAKKKLTKHTRIEKNATRGVKGIIATKPKPSVSVRNGLHPSLFESRPLMPQCDVQKGPIFATCGSLKVSVGEAADFDDEKDYAKPMKHHGTGNKTIAPDKIFVFDDLGADLRHPSISQLLKTNRHEKSKVILSSQYLTDLQPQAIKQLDFCMLFKAFGEDKLERIHQLFDLSTPWDQFFDLYRVATASPFSFLYIDVRSEKFRKNFNISLEVEKSKTSSLKEEERQESKRQKVKK